MGGGGWGGANQILSPLKLECFGQSGEKKRCYVVISWICYHLSTVWFNEGTVSIAVFYIFFQTHYDMYNAFSNHYNMNISIEK